MQFATITFLLLSLTHAQAGPRCRVRPGTLSVSPTTTVRAAAPVVTTKPVPAKPVPAKPAPKPVTTARPVRPAATPAKPAATPVSQPPPVKQTVVVKQAPAPQPIKPVSPPPIKQAPITKPASPAPGATTFTGISQYLDRAVPVVNSLLRQTNNVQSDCLNPHNLLRQVVGLNQLQWDNALAASAQQVSNGIAASDVFDHSANAKRGLVGENLFEQSGSSKAIVTASCANAIIDSWFDEYKIYYGQARAEPVGRTASLFHEYGHYTQLVNAGIVRVGCAFTDFVGKNKLFKRVWTCHYDKCQVTGTSVVSAVPAQRPFGL
ncbi:hypothetical protein HDU91_001877 [Kappamyces sp. JEL0680]|nr:hypothetical protein HDU91_001877 [Kappamyces sp. JEL0680]